jgi:hypothetical protein
MCTHEVHVYSPIITSGIQDRKEKTRIMVEIKAVSKDISSRKLDSDGIATDLLVNINH